MATHSSVLAWRIPGMGEPGGLLSMRLHRVGHDWSDSDLAAEAAVYRKYYVLHWIICYFNEIFTFYRLGLHSKSLKCYDFIVLYTLIPVSVNSKFLSATCDW